MKLLQQLYQDECGSILSAELVLLGTVGVVGATAGLGAVSNSLNDELIDVAYAFRSLDQSYCIEGESGCGSWTAGSCFTQEEVEVSHAELAAWIEERQQAESTEEHESAEPGEDSLRRGSQLPRYAPPGLQPNNNEESDTKSDSGQEQIIPQRQKISEEP